MSNEDLDSFYTFLDHLPIATLVIWFEQPESGDLNAQKIQHVNLKYLNTIGYPLSATPDSACWMDLAYPEPEYRQQIMEKWQADSAKAMQRNEVTAKEVVRIRCFDGRERVFEVFSEVRSTIRPNYYIISFIDITDMTTELEGLKRQSIMDQLTGTYNQHYLLQRANQEIDRALSTGSGFTVMMADLDFFKMVNDRYGHQCGDYVLLTTAEIFRKVLGNLDCLARWNGSDFVILMREENPEIARKIVQRAWQSLRAHSFEWQSHSFAMTITVGITAFQVGDVADSLLERANYALQRGKQVGGDIILIETGAGINSTV